MKKRTRIVEVLKGEIGITLVALVVTIVVLLILAGITLTYVLGDNSIFKQASNAKLETELAKIEEQAGIIYSDKFIEKQEGKVKNREVIDKLIENGNKIEIKSIGEVNIIGVEIEPSEVVMNQNEKSTIIVNLKELEDADNYYAVVDGSYYKINFYNNSLSIEREATIPNESIVESIDIEVENNYDTTIITDIQINQDEKTIELTSGMANGKTTMIVKYGSKTVDCPIIVRDETDWEWMNRVAKAIANDSKINNTSDIAIGKTEKGESYKIEVGGIYKVKYDGQIRRVRVLGFKHDYLVDTSVYGGEHIRAGISFEFLDLMTGSTAVQQNSSSINSGGWGSTKMRIFLNGTEGKEKLSNKDYIKQVKKKYIETYNIASSVTTCNDYLWLLAASEIVNSGYTNGAYGHAITSEGNQYKYYQGVKEEWNVASQERVKYDGSGNNSNWWLRSPYALANRGFCNVFHSGEINANGDSSSPGGTSPGFSI
ncbi:MAG: hypothetical protein HFJ30_04165 [Clostridia bacterium]|nr:hypothetical protein [Clostridia bacterium]MCI9413536.1 hypothetical protein [Clostridia bacterium]